MYYKISELKIQNLNQVMVIQMLLSWVAPHKKVITEKSTKDAGIDVIPRLNIARSYRTNCHNNIFTSNRLKLNYYK